MNQAQFMRQFNETHREEFEPELFRRSNEDLVNTILEVVKSCERDKYFTLKLKTRPRGQITSSFRYVISFLHFLGSSQF